MSTNQNVEKAAVTARERKVLELVQDAVLSVSDEDLHHKTTRGLLAAGSRYVAVKLLAEIAALTQSTNKAVRTAAKGRK